jgi:hypothetical protein
VYAKVPNINKNIYLCELKNTGNILFFHLVMLVAALGKPQQRLQNSTVKEVLHIRFI